MSQTLTVLFIGDIVGNPGMNTIPETEPTLIEELDIQRYVSVNPAEKRMLISRILDKDIAPLVEGLS